MAVALIPLFLISGSFGFVAPPAEEYQYNEKNENHLTGGAINQFWTSILSPVSLLAELKTRTPVHILDEHPHDERKSKNKTYDERDMSMNIHDVVGDVIECTPQYNLRVEFLGENIVDHGNIIESTDCLSQPFVIEWPAQKDAYYTLALVGPDYPSRGKRTEWEEWNHWLVGNIHGDKWVNGEVLAKYIGPHLLKGQGFHRYVFLIYRQPVGLIKFDEPRLDDTIDDKVRANFSIRAFAVKYGMGSPLAGNFFFTP